MNDFIEVETKESTVEEIAMNFFHDRDIKFVENKVEDLKQFLLSLVHSNDRLQRQFNELWDKNWKDKQLQDLKRELEKAKQDMQRGFPITAAEDKMINNWILKHDIEVHNNPYQYHGCSGGGYEYSFQPTGLGTIGKCICTSCKAKAIREKGKDWYDYCKNDLHGIIEFGDFG